MFTKNLSLLCVCALAAVCLLANPGVTLATSIITGANLDINGTKTWTDTSNYSGGVFNNTGGDGHLLIQNNPPTGTPVIGYGSLQVGNRAAVTFNQTGGWIEFTGTSGASFGVLADGNPCRWNMSGDAKFTTVQSIYNYAFNTNRHTWPNDSTILSLTDTASVGITGTWLRGSGGGGGTDTQELLLSGAAQFSASSITWSDLSNTGGNHNYISFASGSTAQLTVGNYLLADFTAKVLSGNIVVDGVAQTDFTKFQVTNTHTLSLIPEPGSLSLLGLFGGAFLLRLRRRNK